MANSDKNIIITPNKGLSGKPEIEFTGSSNDPISIKIDDDVNNASLVVDSQTTTVFSINSNISEGSFFSVSDEYGNTLIDSNSNGTISIGGKDKPVFITGSGVKLPVYETNNIPQGEMGDLVYDKSESRIKYHDGYSWHLLSGEPEDGGGGRGWSPAQGADSSYVIGHTNPSMRVLEQRTLDQGTTSRANPLSFYYPGSTANFSFHTGHTVPSWWPSYYAIQVTDNPRGKVLNQIDWIKHVNGIGNVDFFGSNMDINRKNFTDENNWSWLGRAHFEGSGGQADGTTLTRNFNDQNYGYRWYMIKGVDNNTTGLPHPIIGTRGGWAMYPFRLNKV